MIQRKDAEAQSETFNEALEPFRQRWQVFIGWILRRLTKLLMRMRRVMVKG